MAKTFSFQHSTIRSNVYAIGALLLSLSFRCFAQDMYVDASVDDANRMHIYTNTRKEIVLDMEPEQVGFDDIKISPDGRRVGWLALYPNCCTSYPLPLTLDIFSDNKKITLNGVGLPIWKWSFNDSGQQVTFYQDTTHGGSGTHYETRDLDTNRSIQEWQPEYGRDNRPLETQTIPAWVEEFNAMPE